MGETDPTGDERTFALSRQARLIPIVATQSISSLRSALPGDESWRTLLQCFRTKVFLATSDEFTARDRGGTVWPARSTEGALQRVGVRAGTRTSRCSPGGRRAGKQSLSASKSYAPHHEYIFAPRVFTELQNAQAIVLPYDGLNPLPPQYCYLKPHYLDVQTSYFDHLAAGRAMSSLDRILPFLQADRGPARRSGHHRGHGQRRRPARVRRARRVHRSGAGPHAGVRNLTVAIKNIARACGDEISERQPMLDARLEDGSRVAAMFPPCAVDGPTLTVRKFTRRFTLDDLVAVGTLTAGARRHAAPARSRRRQNILISGGTGTGKTTLLNALAADHPAGRPHRPDRGDVRDSHRQAEPRAVRGATGAGAARPGGAAAGRHHRRPAPSDAAAPAGPDPRRRGARPGSVRPAAGAQHRPPRQPEDDPRELRRAGPHAARALRPDRERRPAAPQHARGDHSGDSPGRAPSSAGRPACVTDVVRVGVTIRSSDRFVVEPLVSGPRRVRKERPHDQTSRSTLIALLVVGTARGLRSRVARLTGPSGADIVPGWHLARHASRFRSIPATRIAPPPSSGDMTWTFEVVPQTNMQSLRATIRSTHPWLTMDTTGSTALSPGNTPPTQISTHGEFNSPRGCRGTFGSVGTARGHTDRGRLHRNRLPAGDVHRTGGPDEGISSGRRR